MFNYLISAQNIHFIYVPIKRNELLAGEETIAVGDTLRNTSLTCKYYVRLYSNPYPGGPSPVDTWGVQIVPYTFYNMENIQISTIFKSIDYFNL